MIGVNGRARTSPCTAMPHGSSSRAGPECVSAISRLWILNHRARLCDTDIPMPHGSDSNVDEHIDWEGEAPAEPESLSPTDTLNAGRSRHRPS